MDGGGVLREKLATRPPPGRGPPPPRVLLPPMQCGPCAGRSWVVQAPCVQQKKGLRSLRPGVHGGFAATPLGCAPRVREKNNDADSFLSARTALRASQPVFSSRVLLSRERGRGPVSVEKAAPSSWPASATHGQCSADRDVMMKIYTREGTPARLDDGASAPACGRAGRANGYVDCYLFLQMSRQAVL